jgi:hypothetical protein
VDKYTEESYSYSTVYKLSQGSYLKICVTNNSKLSLKNLDEIDAGICDGMTYTEIKQYMPEEYAARNANKLVTLYLGYY